MGTYGFFADNNGDRLYSDTHFAQYFADFIGNGVYAKSAETLQVVSNTNMTLKVKAGIGFIQGRWYRSTADENISVAASNGTYGRYDRIVLRCDYAARSIYIYDLVGTPAASPVAPDIVRNGSYYDIALATVYIGQAVTSIAQTNITDTRGNNSVCGWVTGLVQQIDTTNLFAQYAAAWADFVAQLGDDDHVTITTVDTENRAKLRQLQDNVPLSTLMRMI